MQSVYLTTSEPDLQLTEPHEISRRRARPRPHAISESACQGRLLQLAAAQNPVASQPLLGGSQPVSVDGAEASFSTKDLKEFMCLSDSFLNAEGMSTVISQMKPLQRNSD